jgi:acyl carrier protein
MTPASGSPSPLARFPADVQKAFVRFGQTHQPADLQIVVQAALLDLTPKSAKEKLGGSVCAEHRLIEDLGFDSLTVAETIFFFEDLLGVSIQNHEIVSLRTVGDLETFVIRKLAAPAA